MAPAKRYRGGLAGRWFITALAALMLISVWTDTVHAQDGKRGITIPFTFTIVSNGAAIVPPNPAEPMAEPAPAPEEAPVVAVTEALTSTEPAAEPQPAAEPAPAPETAPVVAATEVATSTEPAAAPEPDAEPEPAAETEAAPAPEEAPQLTYVVESGDSLLAIAYLYNTTVEALMAANGLNDPDRLQIGQVLVIPSGSDLVNLAAKHVIKPGDTLLALAFQYGSSLSAIQTANPGIKSNLLQVGQVVKVPLLDENASAQMGQAATSAPAVAPIEGTPGLEAAMLEMLNQSRAENGLPPYQLNDQLISLARNHAQDMVNRGYFGHVTPEGWTLKNRLAGMGINLDRAGENYQYNVQSAERTVQTAFNWFMGDPPHRKNMLHAAYTRVGVGVIAHPAGGYVFVLDFSGDF